MQNTEGCLIKMKKSKFSDFCDFTFNHATGLNDLSPRTMRSILVPFSGTASAEYFQYWKETEELLRRLFQTKGDVMPVTGSIRVAFDSIISSVMEPGEEILVLTNGEWGDYSVDIIRTYGGKPIVAEQNPELPIDSDLVSEKLDQFPDVKAVMAIHVETDIGAFNQVGDIGRVVKKKSNALYIVDCATSLGGMEVSTDKWGADFNFSGSHKCLDSPVGLAFITLNDRAWEEIENRKTPIRSYYTSLEMWKKQWVGRTGHSVYAIPQPALHAVRARIEQILEDGITREYELHRLAAKAIRKSIMEMGFEMWMDCNKCPGCDSPRRFCSDVVSAVKFPDKVSDKWMEFGSKMKYEYNTNVGHHAFGRCGFGKAFHVGTTRTHQLLPRNLLATLTSIGLAMSDLGVDVKLEKGIRAANKVIDDMRKIW